MNYCLEADCEQNQHEWKVTAVNGDMVFLEGYGGSFNADFLYREKPKFFTPFSPYQLMYLMYDRWCGWQKEYISGFSIEEVVKQLNTDTEKLKRTEKKAIAEKEIIIQENTDSHKWQIRASVRFDWRKNIFVVSMQF